MTEPYKIYESCPKQCFPLEERVITYPDAPKHCRIMIVGQAPSFDIELKDRRQTLRDSEGATLFNKILTELKLEANDFYFTNLVKCSSRKKEGLKDNCFPFLEQEIEQVKPEIVVALGKKVLKYLKNKGVGDTYDLRFVYHPAFILRGGYLRSRNGSKGHRVTEEEYSKQIKLVIGDKQNDRL